MLWYQCWEVTMMTLSVMYQWRRLLQRSYSKHTCSVQGCHHVQQTWVDKTGSGVLSLAKGRVWRQGIQKEIKFSCWNGVFQRILRKQVCRLPSCNSLQFCMRACGHACMRACVCAYMRAWLRAWWLGRTQTSRVYVNFHQTGWKQQYCSHFKCTRACTGWIKNSPLPDFCIYFRLWPSSAWKNLDSCLAFISSSMYQFWSIFVRLQHFL